MDNQLKLPDKPLSNFNGHKFVLIRLNHDQYFLLLKKLEQSVENSSHYTLVENFLKSMGINFQTIPVQLQSIVIAPVPKDNEYEVVSMGYADIYNLGSKDKEKIAVFSNGWSAYGLNKIEKEHIDLIQSANPKWETRFYNES